MGPVNESLPASFFMIHGSKPPPHSKNSQVNDPLKNKMMEQIHVLRTTCQYFSESGHPHGIEQKDKDKTHRHHPQLDFHLSGIGQHKDEKYKKEIDTQTIVNDLNGLIGSVNPQFACWIIQCGLHTENT